MSLLLVGFAPIHGTMREPGAGPHSVGASSTAVVISPNVTPNLWRPIRLVNTHAERALWALIVRADGTTTTGYEGAIIRPGDPAFEPTIAGACELRLRGEDDDDKTTQREDQSDDDK